MPTYRDTHFKTTGIQPKGKNNQVQNSHAGLTPDEIKVPLMIIQAIIPMYLCEFYQSDTDSSADEVLLPDSPVR